MKVENLNERIRMLMEQRGLSQKELANLSNITEASLSKYLSGERTPRIDILLNIARALNVSIDLLLGGEKTAINNLYDAKLALARGRNSLSEDDKKELIKFILNNFE